MPRTHRRIHIAPGIHRDGNWLIAEAKVGSSRTGKQQRKRERFPLGTELTDIISWQLTTKGALLKQRPAAAASGTLAADVQRFLDTITRGPKYVRDSISLLRHWTDSPLGKKSRGAITREEVLAMLKQWTDAGVAASSCNHRLHRLRMLYRALDQYAPNPTDNIEGLAGAEKDARNIPPHIVKTIIDAMDDRGRAAKGEKRPKVGETKIRLRVMAWCGAAPETVMKIRKRDLELNKAKPRVFLRPRRKGKPADYGTWVALLPPAVEALNDFVAAGLLGTKGSASSQGNTWRRAIARATTKAAELAAETGDRSWLTDLENLPPRCKPYDLRHSFAAAVYEETKDLFAVMELLQHSNIAMASRYAKGAVSAVVTKAIEAASGRFSSLPTMPAPPAPASPLRLVRSSAS